MLVAACFDVDEEITYVAVDTFIPDRLQCSDLPVGVIIGFGCGNYLIPRNCMP